MMEGWKEVKFGDVVQFPPKISLKKGLEYPFIPMEDIEIGVKYVKSNFKKRLTGGGAKFESGDTLFARITPSLENGKIAQAKNLSGPAFGSTEYFIFRGKEGITDSDFIFYLVNTHQFKQNAINSMVGASGRQRADAGFVRGLKIDLPPLPTQRKIASILSAYDDLIENNLKRIKLLEEKAQLTYEEWFVLRKLNGEIISDSQINIEPLSANIERFINGGWGKEEIVGNYFNEAYVIRGTDMPKVSRGQFDDLPLRYHTESNLKSRLLQHGDIAIEMSNGNIGNVGRSFYFDCGLSKILSKPTICASFCKMIRPKAINLSYLIDAHLKYIYNTNKMLVYKAQAANGINNFNFDEMIKDEELFIPKGEKLDILTDSIRVNYDAISNIRIQNQHLKEARDILLPRLMTGMIDVEQMSLETQQPNMT